MIETTERNRHFIFMPMIRFFLILMIASLSTMHSPLFAQDNLPACGGEDANFQQGMKWFRQRSEGARGDIAPPENISRAVVAFFNASQDTVCPQAASWMYLHSLYFQGNYATTKKKAKIDIFERGKKQAKQFQELWPKDPHPYYWFALFISFWALEKGILTAVKEGVAGQVRDAAHQVVKLNPDFYGGTGWQLLASVYHSVPRIPFLTPWASSETAEGYLNKALARTPNEYPTQFLAAKFYADTDRETTALQILEKLLQKRPRKVWLVEDRRLLMRAQELQNELK